MRSSAYSILGTLAYNQEKYPEAESYYRKSLDAFPSQPDPVVVLRLALALDKQGRYARRVEGSRSGGGVDPADSVIAGAGQERT